ncbi:hypothetical protein ARMGADRAFT_1160602 [Armillaria gallica]|uniref:Uncharacterized protein n=1 Tax=Armillaria gallica TaxID=47427 RepID=A0A2H3EED2_ARMGA|nr:hypothetical protein ARMGADRAFT_1160602 [Armillaria gallica]
MGRWLKAHSSFWLYIHVHTSRGDSLRTKHVDHATNVLEPKILLDISQFSTPSSTFDEQRYTNAMLGCRESHEVCGVISTAGRAAHPYPLDVLGILAVHAYTLLSIHDTILPAAILAPSTSSILPMREKAVLSRSPMTAQCAETGFSDGWLGTRSEKSHAEYIFGGIEMGTPSCADDSQVEFRVSAGLGGILREMVGGESADEDDDHFDRGRVKKAWSGILGTSADGVL